MTIPSRAVEKFIKRLYYSAANIHDTGASLHNSKSHLWTLGFERQIGPFSEHFLVIGPNRDFSASTVCQPCAKDFLCDLSSRYKHCSTVTDSGIGLTLLPQAMGTKKFQSGDPIGTLTLSEMGTFFGRNGDRTAYFRQINRNELTSWNREEN